jgi:exosortase
MIQTPDQADNAPTVGSGRLADMVAAPEGPGLNRKTAGRVAFRIALLVGAFSLLNHWQFRTLYARWLNDPNWSHGFIIPLFSLYLLYGRRDELLRIRPRVCLWGLPLMILALVAQILSYYPISNSWLCQLSMVAVLFFLVLYLGGPSAIRLAWLPILYLTLAMPLPGYIYTRISVPLQEFAAQGSALILSLAGVDIEVTASHLDVVSASGKVHPLTVAEACSGMRSLMAYVALGVAWAYLEERPVWQRMVLVLSIIPVAVVCNILRVSITCTAYVMDRPELGQKFMHTFTGILMLGPALLLFLLLSWLLNRLFIEEEEESDAGPGDPPEAGKPVKEAGA